MQEDTTTKVSQAAPAVGTRLEAPVMQHTPGPWTVTFRHDHSAYISMGDPVNGPHKQFDLELDDLYPSDVADARLMEAAPDLLSALTRLTQQCNRLRMPGQTKSDAEKNAEAVLARVRAA